MFQSTVNINQALGVPGDIIFDGPTRAAPYILDSDGQAQTIGFACTVVTGANPAPVGNSGVAGTAKVGGTGVFAGILSNSKVYASTGTSGAPLDPTLNIPDNWIGELLDMGEIVVTLPGAAAIGDSVYYDNTTGALGTVAPNAAFTAALAAGGAGLQDVLTVSAITAGQLGVGSVIAGAGILPGTYITALGTGTGGVGTYKVNSINTQTVSSEAMTASGAKAPSGKTLIPNCHVSRYAVAGAGVGVIKLTN